MSLINEALKKAQRARHDGMDDPTGPMHAGAMTPLRRGRPDRTGNLVLMGSGALVLVVLSVVATVYLVNRPVQSDPVVRAEPTASVNPAATSESLSVAPPSPLIVAPTVASVPDRVADPSIAPPAAPVSASELPATAATTPVVALPTFGPSSIPPGHVAAPLAVPEAAEPPLATASPPPSLGPDEPDERVTAFVESIRVMGIRSSGTESRVLMNERVYRVNDIVERTLEVRLVNASAENLTFTDPRGVIYVKRF